MDFEQVENDIVNRLKVSITDDDLNIIPIPEIEQEILPAFGKRQIIVAFSSEDSDPDQGLSFVQQETTITFSILLQGKLLRGDKGLYKLAERVKNSLMGFYPTDCQSLTYANHKFVKNDNKVFEYILDFKTIGVRVADTSEDQPIGILNSVTYQEQ